MARPISTASGRKNINLSPAIVRALARAKLDAEERGEEFPATFSAALETALKEWIERHFPEALPTPGPGRPRKTPKRKTE